MLRWWCYGNSVVSFSLSLVFVFICYILLVVGSVLCCCLMFCSYCLYLVVVSDCVVGFVVCWICCLIVLWA